MRTICLAPAVFALTLAFGGCRSSSVPVTNGSTASTGADPADVNIAPVPGYTSTGVNTPAQPARVLGERSEYQQQQASGEPYPEQQGQYPAQESYPQASYSDQGAYPYPGENFDQEQAAVDAGQDALYADQPPPPLPEYQQPELTEPGYLWTPGYWSYAATGYFWVPGAWVAPPYRGALWTPGYWDYSGRRYRFHHGFWASHIGFYGGVPYGYGYTGTGYYGGYWQGENFFYNQQVNRINNRVIRTVYVHPVPEVRFRASYDGPGGLNARPSPAQLAVFHERIIPAMQVQREQARAAAGHRQQFFAENHGRPAMAVLSTRIAADRTPPPAIRPNPEPMRALAPTQRINNSGNPGQPAPGQRGVAERPMDQPRPGEFGRPMSPGAPANRVTRAAPTSRADSTNRAERAKNHAARSLVAPG